MSFEHIRQSRPSAANLLSLMSLFDRQGIPERLIRNRDKIKSSSQVKQINQCRIRPRPIQHLRRHSRRKRIHPEDQGRDEKNNRHGNEFEDDLLILRNYAFISVSETQSAFEMHALVQLAMRAWLEAKGNLETWRRYYCKFLSNGFSTGEYENWAKCQ